MKQIQLVNPFSENWERMQPYEKNRFCSRCQTQVHDMTALNTKEMEQLFRANKGKLCGRLTQAQLTRYNEAQANQPFFRFSKLGKSISALSVMAVAFVSMPLKRTLAANQIVHSQSQFPNPESKSFLENTTSDSTRIAKVTVVDDCGEHIIGASVDIFNVFKKNLSSTITDMEGRATIQILPNYHYLKISYLGLKTIFYTLKPNSDSIIFKMEEDCALLEDIVIMGGWGSYTQPKASKQEVVVKEPVSLSTTQKTTLIPLWKRILFFPYYQLKRVD